MSFITTTTITTIYGELDSRVIFAATNRQCLIIDRTGPGMVVTIEPMQIGG